MSGMRYDFWTALGTMTDLAGLIACLAVAAWLMMRTKARAEFDLPLLVGLGLTAFWSASCAYFGAGSPSSELAESARNLAWLYVVYSLFEGDGRHESLRPVRMVVLALGFVELLQPALMLTAAQAFAAADMKAVFHLEVLLRVLFAVGGLVLLHNLYSGATQSARLALRWPAAAIAAIWLFDLNVHAIAYLIDSLPHQVLALRGLITLAMAVILAIGAQSGSEALRFGPSRTVTFRSISLLVIGTYLAVMSLIGHWLARTGGDKGVALQLGFIVAASIAAALLIPSRRIRGWIKVMLAKHLFQHRYDYRGEWLRFMATIGRRGEEAQPLEQRVIQAVADITESGAGLLLTPGDEGELVLAAAWNWTAFDVPMPALSAATSEALERDAFVVELDAVRSGQQALPGGAELPEWLVREHRAWAIVPLNHLDSLIGAVVLTRPPHARKLDWEDFDLLKVVGQQLASFLAESSGRDALAQAGQFEDFHRRIAFVMHDVKNLASQMALLARNAELHAENPAFRADMLITLRNSADKLNALLARLSRYGTPGLGHTNQTIDLVSLVGSIAGRREPGSVVVDCQSELLEVSGDRDALEQALDHLIQNALDASSAEAPIFVSVTSDVQSGTIEVFDTGEGMSPEFVRTKLFKPFVSTKPGGFGIGAFEARELVRGMGGRLDVESRPGFGTRFWVRLPLASAVEIYDKIEHVDRKVA